MSYNLSPNKATGFSSFELMFKRCPVLPITIPTEEISSQQWSEKECYGYLASVQEALTEAYYIAKAKIDKKRGHMKTMFDRLRPSLKVKEGDYAYIAEPSSKKLRKFEPRAREPYYACQPLPKYRGCSKRGDRNLLRRFQGPSEKVLCTKAIPTD